MDAGQLQPNLHEPFGDLIGMFLKAVGGRQIGVAPSGRVERDEVPQPLIARFVVRCRNRTALVLRSTVTRERPAIFVIRRWLTRLHQQRFSYRVSAWLTSG